MADRAPNGKFLKGNALAFKPGVSGNPAGRPPGALVSEALRYKLVHTQNGVTVAEEIADILIDAARNRDVNAIRLLCDRTEGKARQAIDVDVDIYDWRARARREGLSEADVVREARALIQSYDDDGGGDGDPEETEPGSCKP